MFRTQLRVGHARRSLPQIMLLLALVGLASACGNGSNRSGPGSPVDSGGPGGEGAAGDGGAATPATMIRVLSNRADLISGNDALVEVVLSNGSVPAVAGIMLNAQDVSSEFGLRSNGRFMGLLTGMDIGDNVLRAKVPGAREASYLIVNHPRGGPIFSGPQVQPWRCPEPQTDEFCNRAPVYEFLYKSTDARQSGLQPYDPARPATDVANTTTDQGVTVPFIVRAETGFQNRDRFKILTLFQPELDWQPWAPQAQWNHKLLITHGSNAGVAYEPGSTPMDDYAGTIPSSPAFEQSYIVALGRGFAVMSVAQAHNGHNANIVTQAEGLMMGKEYLIETYGELRYTIGTGCSGGALTQQHVANAYPGIYQGLLPTCSFTDVWSTATQFLDYNFLRGYFERPDRWGAGVAWVERQMADVAGHGFYINVIATDELLTKAKLRPNPSTENCPGLEAAEIYQPDSNPAGIRCWIPEFMINVLGRRPAQVWSANEVTLGKGFAGIPFDSVGVQYGLSVLQSGTITPLQFLDLNEKIGSLDIDARPSPDRFSADQPALANAYRSGAINTGNFLNQVAIIDGRGPDPGAAHDSYRAFSMRARLDKVHGHHDNHVLWTGPTPLVGDQRYTVDALIAIDRWLAAVEADMREIALAQKLTENKPADVGDRCSDGSGTKLSDGICPDVVGPVYGTPRTVAGDSIRADTNKCQLKPLDPNDNYGPVPFLADQWARMLTLFPEGVCDYSLPPVSAQETLAWLEYGDENGGVIYGGRPMTAPPADSALGWASPAFRNASPTF